MSENVCKCIDTLRDFIVSLTGATEFAIEHDFDGATDFTERATKHLATLEECLGAKFAETAKTLEEAKTELEKFKDVVAVGKMITAQRRVFYEISDEVCKR